MWKKPATKLNEIGIPSQASFESLTTYIDVKKHNINKRTATALPILLSHIYTK